MVMASSSLKLFIMMLLSTWTVGTTVMARPLSFGLASSNSSTLQLEENNKCWETMLELQSCTGEVIIFFLNGETYLGPACCHALLKIAQQCWPDMLSTLGLTQQEGDMLRGYCDGIKQESSLASSSVIVNASYPTSNNSIEP